MDIPVDNETGLGYLQLEKNGITKNNFVNALVIDVNSVTIIPYTYSGFVYLTFKSIGTMEGKAITGTVRVWYY